MATEGIHIPFDFSSEGQEKLLNEIIQLQEGLKKLAEEMAALPIEEVTKRNVELKLQLRGIQEQCLSSDKSFKDLESTLYKLTEEAEAYSAKVTQGIQAQLAAKKSVDDINRELKANESILNSVTKALEQHRAGVYKGKQSVEELQAVLVSTRNNYKQLSEELERENELIQEQAGYFAKLKALVAELVEQRDKLIETEGAENEEVSKLTVLIQKYNLELQINKRELDGINTANSLFQKTSEAVARATNENVQATASLIVERKKFNQQVDSEVAKMLGAETKEEAIARKKSERNEKMLLDAQRREIAEVQAATKTAEANERAANKSIWSWENFGNVFERVGLRTAASLIWWGVVIGAATALYEWWTKIDDATQSALDRLKQYTDDFKKFKSDLKSLGLNTAIEERKEQLRDNLLINVVLNPKSTQSAIVNAYEKLHSAHSTIIEDLTEEQKKHHAILKLTDEQIRSVRNLKQAREIETRLNTREPVIEEAISSELRAKNRLDLLEKYTTPERRKLIDKYISNNLKTHSQFPGYVTNIDKFKSSALSDKAYAKLERGDIKDFEEGIPIRTFAEAYLGARNEYEIAERNKSNLIDKQQQDEEAFYNLTHLPRDKKTPKGPKDRTLENLLQALKNEHETTRAGIYEAKEANIPGFEEPQVYKMQLTELESYIRERQHLIDEYAAKEGKTKAEIRKLNTETDKEEADGKKALTKEYYTWVKTQEKLSEEEVRNVDNFLHKIQELNRQIKDEIEKGDKSRKINQSRLRKTSVSLLNIFGVDTPSWKEQQIQDQAVIDEKSANVSNAANQVNEDKKLPWSLGNSVKTLQDQVSFQKSANELADANDKLKLDKKKAVENAKKKILQETFSYSVNLINQEFEFHKNRIKQQQEILQENAQYEQTLAGNNFGAKQKIAQEEHNKMIALKRKEAQIEKEQAIFSATVNMFKGIAEAIGSAPPPYSFILAGLVAAFGAVQIADITKQPLPSYKKGRTGGPKELAEVGEEGFEIAEHQGKYRILEHGVTELKEGEIVHTHKESETFLKKLMKGTEYYNSRKEKERTVPILTRSDLDYLSDRFDSSLKKHRTEIHLPAQDVQERLWKQQKRNGL